MQETFERPVNDYCLFRQVPKVGIRDGEEANRFLAEFQLNEAQPEISIHKLASKCYGSISTLEPQTKFKFLV